MVVTPYRHFSKIIQRQEKSNLSEYRHFFPRLSQSPKATYCRVPDHQSTLFLSHSSSAIQGDERQKSVQAPRNGSGFHTPCYQDDLYLLQVVYRRA